NQQSIIIYKRESGTANWTQAGTAPNTATSFIDPQVNTRQTVYEYKATIETECGAVLETNIHNTIVLQAKADEAQGIVTLNWNRYKGWDNGVKEYQIYRKLDNETTFTLVPNSA